jgi:hypothetical protein
MLDRAGAACGGRASRTLLPREARSWKSRFGEAALLPLRHWRVIVKRQEFASPNRVGTVLSESH